MTDRTGSAPLDGRVAIVTGGSSGIGRGIALKLRSQGAQVVVSGLEDLQQVDRASPSSELLPFERADATSRSEMNALVASCLERHGRLDIMVACAGIGEGSTTLDTTDHLWERVLAVNLYGALLAVQVSAPAMQTNGHGRIILISSTNAFWVEAGMMAYNVSKAGVAALVRTAAIELAPSGITVNALAPGMIETAMTEATRSEPESAERYLSFIPAGRFGLVSDVAAGAAFLASDEAAWTTGQLLVVDGGQTAGIADW